MKTKMIKSQHHRDQMVPLTLVLHSFASQEGCDGEEYDAMKDAANYIDELEQKIKELEAELAPYREMETALYKRIKEMDKRQDNEAKSSDEGMKPCALSSICRAVKVNCNEHCPSFIKEKIERKKVITGMYCGEEPLNVEGDSCIRCNGRNFQPDHATITDQCSFCGQKYRRF